MREDKYYEFKIGDRAEACVNKILEEAFLPITEGCQVEVTKENINWLNNKTNNANYKLASTYFKFKRDNEFKLGDKIETIKAVIFCDNTRHIVGDCFIINEFNIYYFNSVCNKDKYKLVPNFGELNEQN